MISSIATLKKRPKPTSLSHESVGTEGTIKKLREAYDKLRSLSITARKLDPLVMSVEVMEQWGFMVKLPDGPGGSRPHDEGKIRKCERCAKQYVVKGKDEADFCTYHWGRALMSRFNGMSNSLLILSRKLLKVPITGHR